jgi:hypothetical protein
MPNSEITVSCEESFYTDKSVSQSVSQYKQANPTPLPPPLPLPTHSIKFRQIPPFRKVSTETSLGAPTRNATKSAQDPRRTENAYTHDTGRNHRRETVHDHGDIVKDIRSETVGFTLRFQRRADAVRE